MDISSNSLRQFAVRASFIEELENQNDYEGLSIQFISKIRLPEDSKKYLSPVSNHIIQLMACLAHHHVSSAYVFRVLLGSALASMTLRRDDRYIQAEWTSQKPLYYP